MLRFLLLSLAIAVAGAGIYSGLFLDLRGEQQLESKADLAAKPAEAPRVKETHSPRMDRYGDPIPAGALARLGTTRHRHTLGLLGYGGEAESVLFSRDSQAIVTAGKSRPPRLWDVVTGKLLRQFSEKTPASKKPDALPRPLALSPDGRILASSMNETIYLWEIFTGKLLYRWPMRAIALVFSADGKILKAARQNDRTCGICCWEVATGKELQKSTLAVQVHKAVFSPDGNTLASINEMKCVQLWDMTTGEPVHQLPESKDSNYFADNIAFSPNSRFLATTSNLEWQNSMPSNGATVCIWDVATGKEVRQISSDRTGTMSVAFSPDGKLLAVGSSGAPIRLWNVATGKEVRSCQGYRSHISSLAFSSDGKLLVSGAAVDDDATRVWEVATGKEVGLFLGGHTASVLSVAFTPDGKSVVSGGMDGAVEIWDAATGGERRAPLRVGDFHSLAAVSANGNMIAAIGNSFTPNSRNYLRAAVESPTLARLWDAGTGQERCQFAMENGYAQSLAVSSDGKTIALTYFGYPHKLNQATLMCSVWDVATGKKIYTFDQGGLYCAAFSPDSKVLAGGFENGDVFLWNKATGKQLFHAKGHSERVDCLTFSPDGKWLATASKPGKKPPEIRLWRFQQGTGWTLNEILLMTGNEGWFYALAFSPDGKTLAAAGEDGALFLWEAATGKERRRFVGHQGGIWCLAFAPDGRRIASGSMDSTILIWDVTGRLEAGQLRPPSLSAPAMEPLWTDLASNDALRAGRAIWTLVATGSSTVSFLNTRLRSSAQMVTPEAINQMIADLDADAFAVRQKARKKLEALGTIAEQSLRQALEKKPSLQKRHCIKQLLALVDEKRSAPSRELLRELRAIEVLEQIGTLEARKLLAKLSFSVLGDRKSEEAKASLTRLARQAKPH